MQSGLPFVQDPTARDQGSASRRSALIDVSFAIEAGEFVAVLGPSGSGKSTLLNLLGGFDCATSGSLEVDDVDLSNAQRTGERDAAPRLAPQKDRNDRKLAMQRLREVALEPLAERPLSTLSAGHRQRVTIARALVHSLPSSSPTNRWATPEDSIGREILDLLNIYQPRGDKNFLFAAPACARL